MPTRAAIFGLLIEAFFISGTPSAAGKEIGIASAVGLNRIAVAREPSDDEIRQAIVQQSLAQYRGNCPCPYNAAANGGRCGRRSAYSRAGGASPLCFPADVTDEAVRRYRASVR